jgi:hypothetical protein
MAKTLLCGGSSKVIDASAGWYVEADLGNPILGPPGLVTLFKDSTPQYAVYLGVYSLKFRL